VKRFHPDNYAVIESNNALYGAINDAIAASPFNWMFDYYN